MIIDLGHNAPVLNTFQEGFDQCHEASGLGAAELGQLLVDSGPVEAGVGARGAGARQSGLVARALGECGQPGELLQGSRRFQIVSAKRQLDEKEEILINLRPFPFLDQKTNTSE